MSHESVITTKSEDFGVRIIHLYKHFLRHGYVPPLTTQILRSGTAIGECVAESQDAESTSDFIHKLRISLKEANETRYWLRLFHRVHYLTDAEFESMNGDCVEIIKILNAIINSTRKNNGK